MKKIIVIASLLFIAFAVQSETIYVKNIAGLTAANKRAMPGDIIILQNGTWQNCAIVLTAKGTAEKPIIFKCAEYGMLRFSGLSSLRISGEYLLIDGFSFIDGHSPKGNVWDFKSGDEVANHCRISNSLISDFSNPRRIDENSWIGLYGKENRIDHCIFSKKENFGVLLEVLLDDDRSRLNNHSIDSNHFVGRRPLGSNGGEIIRVGLAQHCTFYSNTNIHDNIFEHCDGEAEIISIKSCGNIIRGNIFNKCQGSLVLRHGNDNIVEGNRFFGLGKEGTGGIRLINEGNWIVNNLFYNCRGENFRSPLAIMNGVFNSPPKRYLPVRNAVIANNTFINCAPFSLCEGSDSERTVTPKNVYFFNNLFLNTSDSLLYYEFDNTDSIFFKGNAVSTAVQQTLKKGFSKISNLEKEDKSKLARAELPDSIMRLASSKLLYGFPLEVGSSNEVAAKTWSGFYQKRRSTNAKKKTYTPVYCKDANCIIDQLKNDNRGNSGILIQLTSSEYYFNKPLDIKHHFIFGSSMKNIKFICPDSSAKLPFLFQIYGGGNLEFDHLDLDLAKLNVESFIVTDTSGSSNHLNFIMENCSIKNLKSTNQYFFEAKKYSFADSIMIRNSVFTNNNCTLFNFAEEDDKKGYYNVEKLSMEGSSFINQNGSLLTMLRSGIDESTLGPLFIFKNNTITDCNSTLRPFIDLIGTQKSYIQNNQFTNSSRNNILIGYTDYTRAKHILSGNKIRQSGRIESNQFVQSPNNLIQ